MSSQPTPETITGGCLCEKIRYTVKFPKGHDFAAASSTCQCEQCRKNTGSLIYRVHTVPTKDVAFTSKSTLGVYSASPGNQRGFCNECGSFLFWMKENGGKICLTVGCFDKAALKDHGVILTDAKTHLWCNDEIPGVTDHLRGEKWRYHSRDDDEKAELIS